MMSHFLGQTGVPPVELKHRSVEKLHAGFHCHLPTFTSSSSACLKATFKAWGHFRGADSVMFPDLCDSVFIIAEH